MNEKWFQVRVALMRLMAVFVLLPIGLIVVPYLMFKKRADWESFRSLFSPREWRDMIGHGPEITAAPYRVVNSDYHKKMDELPDNCWYHASSKKVSCLTFEDAAFIRLKYNGTIQTREKDEAQSSKD